MMSKKLIAIVGSYRKGGINDQAVEAILDEARQAGTETRKIYLTDEPIQFCTNCRVCMSADPSRSRGRCVIDDAMEPLLSEIDGADAIVFASPLNIWTVTAVMKRFLERTGGYCYWPWGQPAPRLRIRAKTKKAVIVTSSACPAVIGGILMPQAQKMLKSIAESIGARVVKSLYFGMACSAEKQRLNTRQLTAARRAAQILVA